jgi:hypothetical protein
MSLNRTHFLVVIIGPISWLKKKSHVYMLKLTENALCSIRRVENETSSHDLCG